MASLQLRFEKKRRKQGEDIQTEDGAKARPGGLSGMFTERRRSSHGWKVLDWRSWG